MSIDQSPCSSSDVESPRPSPRNATMSRMTMPSIRTTKRRIIRIGSLERTPSFDKGARRLSHASVNASVSDSLRGSGLSCTSSTSSIASAASASSQAR